MKKLLLLAPLIALLAAGCNSSSTGTNPYSTTAPAGTTAPATMPTPTPAPAPTLLPTPGPVGQIKSFTIMGMSYSYSPSSITVNKGDTVKITFQNNEGFHNLTVSGYNVATPSIAAGSSATIQFVASQSGTFQYFCSIANHRAMGMVGNLVVR